MKSKEQWGDSLHHNVDYTVIRDTREKPEYGWKFPNMKVATLPTGDYTVEGKESLLCIERKGSIAEFATNICQKRFWAELERMKEFAIAALILEFTEADIINWPSSSGIPPSRWKYLKVRTKFIFSCIKRIREDFPNIEVILAGKNGVEYATRFFERSLDYAEIVISRENKI